MNDEIEHEEVKEELENLLELTLQLEHDFNNFVSELDYK